MFILFQDKFRLLTGQDEVTNRLVNRVARHIDGPLQLHLAIEQLGLTWNEVSVVHLLRDYKQVRYEGNTETNITRNDRKYLDNWRKDLVAPFNTL